ncbi:preprotein translocase subunit SecY [Paracholeplasma manati]|uniref:Protein translocase subunit SecY n=1 Tax=Paracholeplasma manati TaxID=591373 RepID=A0ABT2Y4G7_9MOLU|nr:preprotein translocase subunit SecY [Paracholeplasma manati]MCV2231625.1 preprotein translocase subunit SecY [Paracholeplasma manati]MDG0888632.1 preprotein translocase subunit SecY [Paracholeplasma manati]
MYRIKAIFSNVQLLKRIGITLALLFIFRITTWIPIPLIDTSSISEFISGNDFLAILNNFTGNALGRFSIMAMGISPYITASIVVQMLQMDIVPILKEWSEQGETGKQKLNKLTRILGLVLAFVQSLVLLLGLGVAGSEFLPDILSPSPILYIYMSLVVTAGAAFAMYIADLITRKGIGNGTSLLIVAGIITSLPSMITLLWGKYITNGNGGWDIVLFIAVILIYLAVLLGVTFLELAKRRIPIQYANRQAGQGKTNSDLPIKLNTAGVIPVIFASTILSIPLSISGMFGLNTSSSLGSWLDQIFNYQQPIGFVLYIGLIVVFTFFYSFLMLNPETVAGNLSKSNAYIPGVRPGLDTQNYIARLMFKITLLGTVYLVILAAMPIVTSIVFGFNSTESQAIVLGGTSLLIVVGVAIETTNQVETEANDQEYKGIF